MGKPKQFYPVAKGVLSAKPVPMIDLPPVVLASDYATLEAELAKLHAELERRAVDVSAMARVLSDRAADACNIDHDDNWAMYGQEYIDDVQAMLAAAPSAPKADEKSSAPIDDDDIAMAAKYASAIAAARKGEGE